MQHSNIELIFSIISDIVTKLFGTEDKNASSEQNAKAGKKTYARNLGIVLAKSGDWEGGRAKRLKRTVQSEDDGDY